VTVAVNRSPTTKVPSAKVAVTPVPVSTTAPPTGTATSGLQLSPPSRVYCTAAVAAARLAPARVTLICTS
jgi:hypothetical protein